MAVAGMPYSPAGSKHALSPEETVWAKELLEALRAAGVPRPETDFELAQFAIISKGDAAKGVKRVTKHNEVILGVWAFSEEEAQAAVGFCNKLWPGFVAAGKPDDAGRPVLVCDTNHYLPALLKGEENFRSMFIDLIQLFQGCNADLNDTRNGCTWLTQCRGMGWKNFSLEIEKRASVLYQDALPFKYHTMPCVNAGPIIRLMFKACKLFMKQKMKERLIVCSQEELVSKHGYRLEDLPPLLGGTYEAMPYEQWLRESLARRRESMEKVRIS